jgi:hypothetical protein
MIKELIQLAEEIYARGHNPNLDPEANAVEFKEFAIRLGHLIEECGMTLRRYQERVEQQSFYIKKLENRIKELTEE